MLAIPSPQPIGWLAKEAVDEHRDVWCRHYDDCLDRAVLEGWSSFSCAACPLRGEAQVRDDAPTWRMSPAEAAAAWSTPSRLEVDPSRPRKRKSAGRREVVSQSEILEAMRAGPLPADDPLPSVYVAVMRRQLARLEKKGMVTKSPAGWVATGRKICGECKQAHGLAAYAPVTGKGDGHARICMTCDSKGGKGMLEQLDLGQVQDVCAQIRRWGEAGYLEEAAYWSRRLRGEPPRCSVWGCGRAPIVGRPWCREHVPAMDRPREPKASALRILGRHPNLSNASIARISGLSHEGVRELREALGLPPSAARTWRRGRAA